jgi:hypothetical protein
MTDHLTSRAQRLLDEFEEGESVRHGIANVLRHIAETEYDMESWYSVPQSKLHDLANQLTTPTLLERALAGDRGAARKFLQKLGMIDANGQLTAPYRLEDRND